MTFYPEKRFIDLSVPISPDYHEIDPIQCEVINHRDGADLLGQGQITHRDFPDHAGLSLMHYTLSTHTGTHMDSPYHYGEKDNQDNPAKTISDIPLSWCFSNGLLIDVSDGDPATVVSKTEIMNSLSEQNQIIAPQDIVLLYTNKQSMLGASAYFTQYRGVSREAVEFLVDHGVRIIGIDSFSFDPPFQSMIQQYIKTRDNRCLWPAHMLGREKPYCQLERLTHLDQLKPYRQFTVCCFPVHLYEADASWCRVVAIINEST